VFTSLLAAMVTSESPADEGCQMQVIEHKRGMERLHTVTPQTGTFKTNKTSTLKKGENFFRRIFNNCTYFLYVYINPDDGNLGPKHVFGSSFTS
jgi:hypothetical protein